ncbi:MAG: hypothetical protein C4576_06975 [Desulfobacteraceae bacterium]|nr:MAG: hypothetical protein C4576_06975 [Desulfobacteraceae bacterium]
MEKIVNLEERIENRKQREKLEHYRGRVETVQKILQCSSCNLKCAMCGAQIEDFHSGCCTSGNQGFRFCECCREEFEEFLAVKKGGKTSELFWHNKEWKEMWSAWLDYRKAMTAFLRSAEFKLMLDEFNEKPE